MVATRRSSASGSSSTAPAVPSKRKSVPESVPEAAPSCKRAASSSGDWPMGNASSKLERYSGTINLYKRWRWCGPGSGPPQIEEFESGLIETQDELAIVVDKLNTIGYVGSKGGPGSRRDFGHPLLTASEKRSINFKTHVVAMAIFPQRVRDPTIVSAAPTAGADLQVACGDRGRNWSSIPSRSGEKLVGFAAIVLPRPPDRQTWQRAVFSFGHELAASDDEDSSDDDEGA